MTAGVVLITVVALASAIGMAELTPSIRAPVALSSSSTSAVAISQSSFSSSHATSTSNSTKTLLRMGQPASACFPAANACGYYSPPFTSSGTWIGLKVTCQGTCDIRWSVIPTWASTIVIASGNYDDTDQYSASGFPYIAGFLASQTYYVQVEAYTPDSGASWNLTVTGPG